MSGGRGKGRGQETSIRGLISIKTGAKSPGRRWWHWVPALMTLSTCAGTDMWSMWKIWRCKDLYRNEVALWRSCRQNSGAQHVQSDIIGCYSPLVHVKGSSHVEDVGEAWGESGVVSVLWNHLSIYWRISSQQQRQVTSHTFSQPWPINLFTSEDKTCLRSQYCTIKTQFDFLMFSSEYCLYLLCKKKTELFRCFFRFCTIQLCVCV